MKAQSLPLSQAVVRLDGQYGNGAIVADLAGLAERSCGARIMISSTFLRCKLAWLSRQISKSPIRKREPVGPSLTFLTSCFRQQDHAHGSSLPHGKLQIPR